MLIERLSVGFRAAGIEHLLIPDTLLTVDDMNRIPNCQGFKLTMVEALTQKEVD